MSIRKERFGMYAATIHYRDSVVTFIAPSRMGAWQSASKFAWSMK